MKPLHIEDQRAIALALTVTPLDTRAYLLVGLTIGFTVAEYIGDPAWAGLFRGAATTTAAAGLALFVIRWVLVRRVDAMGKEAAS